MLDSLAWAGMGWEGCVVEDRTAKGDSLGGRIIINGRVVTAEFFCVRPKNMIIIFIVKNMIFLIFNYLCINLFVEYKIN